MGGAKKYHVGFPEKAIDKYVPILVNHGYRVAVVEQTETPRQLEKRLKDHKARNADKCVMRDLCNVYTKGTYFDANDGSYEPKWILSFGCDFDYNVGVVFFDITTLKLHIGQFKDNQMFGKFRTLAMQLRPTEIVYDKGQVRPEMIKILTNSPVCPVKSALSSKMCYNSFKAIAKVEGLIGDNKEDWPKPLADLSQDLDISEIAFSSLGMTIAYLENCMNEHLIKLFDYHLYDPSKMLDSKMILDSQALEHLQILEVRTTNSVSPKGSLLYLIDDTRTPFGKRLLKKWVSSPLVKIDEINSRLDSIEDLIEHPHEMDVIRTKLLKLNDMEKQLSKLYQYSVNRNKKAIYFEDVSLKKLKEFHDTLNKMNEIPEYIESLAKKKQDFKSERLRQLVTIKKSTDHDDDAVSEDFEQINDPNGLFPDLNHELKEFESMVSWKKIGNERIPEPCKGIDQTFDEANEIVNSIKAKFEQILIDIRSRFNNDPNM